ncbi:MAG: SDR family NAD(P)-dependent oxidoreductase [Proteobacteria bacterium]|nr:SDR family NAD(P)-dependent oxidoreductase [Pseudomonadota bacterium]
MRIFVTGCAGFIGSQMVDRLLSAGHKVVGYDNLSTGMVQFLQSAQRSENFTFITGDLLDLTKLTSAMQSCTMVMHFAANADVRFGINHPNKDLEQNTIATFHVLEAMRTNGIKQLVFASTGSIYGEAAIIPTPENAPFPIQTSLYGASKLAAEGMIQAYCEGFGYQAYIFRFVSILGERYTHGHVFDFYEKLLKNPNQLEVLGNGQQKKSYLYVHDCIDAIFIALEKAKEPVNIFNLGTDQYCQVNDSIGWICDHLKIDPKRIYSGGERGWIGDNPFIYLDCSRIRKLGWQPKYSIRQAIIATLTYLQTNHWVYEQRKISETV